VALDALAREPFGYDEMAANHVLDMPMSRRTKFGRASLAEEARNLRDLEARLRSGGPAEDNVDQPRSNPDAADAADADAPIAFLASVIQVDDVAAECDFYQRLGMQIVKVSGDTESVLVKPGIPLFGVKPVLFVLEAGSRRDDSGGDGNRVVEVADIDEAIKACRSAGIAFETGEYDQEAGLDPRFKIRTPDGQSLILQRP
jgi:hypothetical protein